VISRQNLVLAISASIVVGVAIGLIAGVLFARSFLFPHAPRGPHAMGGGPMHPRHEMGMRFLERQLDLDDEQVEQIEKIVDRARGRADSLHDDAREQIHALLTPEQREQWDRMNRRMFPPHSRGPRGSGRGRGPGPDGPPPMEPGGPPDEP